MVEEQEAIKAIRAQLERESAIGIHRNAISIRFDDHTLVVEGEVDSIAAKRLALRVVRANSPDARAEDRLRVTPSERREDGAIRDSLIAAFTQERAFHDCSVAIWNKGELEPVTDATGHSPCYMQLSVKDGVVTLEGEVISLSHRRLALLLAWWATGVRDVVDHLRVVPDEEDTDAELMDAIQLALDKDPMLRGEMIRAHSDHGAVTLEGMARGELARQIAEDDVWYLGDVQGVDNRIRVAG
ncbi:MAG TPA: BON domain-containing protein [Gammaproteobacteria bacterium]|nr:BON domain-containing protein [Gammaproteobacteria bacterium]